MRAYTLSILSKLAAHDGRIVAEKEIAEWANDKVSCVEFIMQPSIQMRWQLLRVTHLCYFSYRMQTDFSQSHSIEKL